MYDETAFHSTRYLLNRDKNGVAEWNKCNLSRLKSEWLETAFTSQNSVSVEKVDFSKIISVLFLSGV